MGLKEKGNQSIISKTVVNFSYYFSCHRHEERLESENRFIKAYSDIKILVFSPKYVIFCLIIEIYFKINLYFMLF